MTRYYRRSETVLRTEAFRITRIITKLRPDTYLNRACELEREDSYNCPTVSRKVLQGTNKCELVDLTEPRELTGHLHYIMGKELSVREATP